MGFPSELVVGETTFLPRAALSVPALINKLPLKLPLPERVTIPEPSLTREDAEALFKIGALTVMSALAALIAKVPVDPTTKPVPVPVPPLAIVKVPVPVFNKPLRVKVVLDALLPHVTVSAPPV
jgi:hypothetical protein